MAFIYFPASVFHSGEKMVQSIGYLTTHILDTANGCPANGVTITLYALNDGTRTQLASTVTNNDGRTDKPILAKGELKKGVYELVFEVGNYFKGKNNTSNNDLPFVDIIPIRFGIANDNDHYHVPLLVSPFSFSTYRGS